MNVCCDSFQRSLNSEERGFSIVIEDSIYKVEFKVVEDEYEDDLASFFKEANSIESMKKYRFKNLSLGGKMGIQYCPWCGTSLYESEPKKKGFWSKLGK